MSTSQTLQSASRGITGTVLRGKTSQRYEWKDRHYISVSAVLAMLGKEALIYWSARETAKRAAELMGVIDASIAVASNPDASPQAKADAKASREGAMAALRDYDTLTNHHRKVRDKAAIRGTKFHDIAENYGATGQFPDVDTFDPVIRPRALLLRQWYEKYQPDIQFVETTVISTDHGYAGTLDSIMVIDGRTLIVDFKTSKDSYPEHQLQLAAYRHANILALDKTTGTELAMPHIDGTAILVVNDTECSLCEWDTGPEVFDTFLSVMDVWKWSSAKPTYVRDLAVSIVAEGA